MTIKNIIYVEANVMNIYAKFQLHPPYGFWEEDFLIFFSEISINLPEIKWKLPRCLFETNQIYVK